MAKKKHRTIGDIFDYHFYALLGRLFRITFSILTRRKLAADKPLSDFSLVLFSGHKGSRMIKAVLLSIYYRWEKIPPVILVSDGTPKEALQAVMQFWPYPFEIKSWEDCAAFHQEKGRQSIVEFSRVNIFARKLLSVLAEAEIRPVLYCDTDVIWLAEPRLPVTAPGKSCSMRISTDIVHCYHIPAIRWLNRPDLLEKPAINAGVVYMSGPVYEEYTGFDEIMGFMKIFDEGPAEQMSFALLADRLGDTWSLEEIYLNITDTHWPLLPGYLFSGKAFARHHVATKHSWFWRDILLIVLFKRKKHRRPAAA
jgi:hypothetical protein